MTPIDELNQRLQNLDDALGDRVYNPIEIDWQFRHILVAQQQQIADLNERLSKLENKNGI